MLFPEVDQPRLVGIAKLAAESDVLEHKRRVTYFEISTRKFIGRASGRKMPFDWTINPYRGCEFGCKYCYARYTHEFMEKRDTRQFEEEIYAKEFSKHAFRQELRRIPGREGICIGSATDPYQPAERRFGVTRSILEVFAGERGHTLSITTKSDLVARDADLLAEIARHNSVHVCMTVTTMDTHLARLLEPYAPRPDLRVAAMRTLTSAGIQVMTLCCPLMPLINDSEPSIEAVAKAVSAAGSTYMMGNPLFLKPCAQKAFFPFLEAEMPHLLRRYRERYEREAFLKGDYVEKIAARMKSVRERYGLSSRPDPDLPPAWPGDEQLALFASAVPA